jgi:hypothetical protein
MYVVRFSAGFLPLLIFSMAVASPGALVELNERAYAAVGGNAGVIVFEVNWGRQWGCGGLDNAQLQALTFSQWPDGPRLELKTPSRLFVNDEFRSYSLIVQPGEYFLTDYDVKVAKSVREVGHLIGRSVLFENDRPIGGSFTAKAGEFVYIGHFSLDCSLEPIPWRYYVVGEEGFRKYSDSYRDEHPYIGDTAIEFRLFDTSMFGTAYSLGDGS